ncbi:olfactory receptor 8G17-like [Fundulus diaphanus]
MVECLRQEGASHHSRDLLKICVKMGPVGEDRFSDFLHPYSFSFRSEEIYTFNSFTLQLESLNVSEESRYAVFLFIILSYLFIIVANFGIAVLVFVDRSLHQPMYLLFCNLSANDVLGNSVVLPRLLLDILRPPSERLIGYYECVLQAFIIHMFNTTSHTVLMIMAFDRYVAIGNPLRYSAIMSNKMLAKLTAGAWGAAFVLVGILLGLTVRLSRCRTFMQSLYCNNAALFLLSCENIFINNVYGLTFTVVLFTASIGSMVVTYTKITVVCLTSKNKTLNSKALKTCSTHLLVYLIMFFSGIIIIILHRYPQYSEEKKIAAVLYHIIPGALNPIIYGMQSKEIRKYFSRMFYSNKVLMSS